jgi:beta-glucosidase
METVYQKNLPVITADDLKIIHQPLDFLGYNIYTGVRIKADQDGNPEKVIEGAGIPRTAMDWNIVPEALYWGPKFLCERYQLPFYITENGMANLDWVSEDGRVHDPQRIDFLQKYLRQYLKLANEGADLRGYFQWSLLDNFEWAFGYSRRFGLVHIDFQTGKRTVKDSGHWYKQVADSNGIIL